MEDEALQMLKRFPPRKRKLGSRRHNLVQDVYFPTILDVMKFRTQRNPSQLCYRYLEDGEVEGREVTYQDIWDHARAIAALVQKENVSGGSVILLYPPNGLDFILAFYGSMISGSLCVPTYPPDPSRIRRSLNRFNAILEDCHCTLILTIEKIRKQLMNASSLVPKLAQYKCISTDSLDLDLKANWIEPKISPETIAFLQYTSGSTGDPKGVIVDQKCLMYNEYQMMDTYTLEEYAEGAGWLPLYHDMGLIGQVIQCYFAGATGTVISPLDFIKRPYRWLKVCSQIRGFGGGAPNFAFEYLVNKLTPMERDSLDLSSVQVLFSGAEPIRAQTLEKFARFFKPCGVSRDVLTPTFGLAEATLLVSGSYGHLPPIIRYFSVDALEQRMVETAFVANDKTRALVACGVNQTGSHLCIVDPDTRVELPRGRVGEIWVSGPTVASGYWKKPEISKEIFQAELSSVLDPSSGADSLVYLRTGDLGFLSPEPESELFICGRVKDMIILMGKNYFPQDIEETVENSHEMIHMGCVAAFPITVENEPDEKLVVVAEVTNEFEASEETRIFASVLSSVQHNHQLPVHSIVLIAVNTINKTSSGKIQRRRTKMELAEGKLKIVGEWTMGKNPIPQKGGSKKKEKTEGGSGSGSGNERKRKRRKLAMKKKSMEVAPISPRSSEIQSFIISKLSEISKIPSEEIDPQGSFANLGIDSAAAISLSGEIETFLETKLPNSLVYEYPNIELLSRYLGGEDPRVLQEMVENFNSGQEGNDDLDGDEDDEDEDESRLNSDPVSIVGMSCRFPQSPDLDTFWTNLCDGKDCISMVPPERYPIEKFFDERPGIAGKTNAKAGGFLLSSQTPLDAFDGKYFGITAVEASTMDPQQRLLCEVIDEALQDAGIPRETLNNSKTGVFIGCSSVEYGTLASIASTEPISNPFLGTGNSPSIASNRISYLFNLHGPSLTVDTACSSSLVALDSALSAMRNGSADMAIVGGCNLLLTPVNSVILAQAGFLSVDGRCKTFSESGDGFARAEGVAAIILKKSKFALRNSDRIYASVLSTHVNSDGRSNGLTAPNGLMQQALVREALFKADREPEDVAFVECHGTGTKLGDPIEVHALGQALKPDNEERNDKKKEHRVLLGSVKSNIGHMEAAAGIGGIVKAALSLYHRKLPPTIHCEELNSRIDWEAYPHLSVQRAKEAVTLGDEGDEDGEKALVAGVSSFGFGGTNAHAILESVHKSSNFAPDPSQKPKSDDEAWHVLPVSSSSPAHLLARARDLLEYFTSTGVTDAMDRRRRFKGHQLENVVSTLVGRCNLSLPHRMAIVGNGRRDVLRELKTFVAVEGNPSKIGKMTSLGSVRHSSMKGQAQGKICYVFSGQGPQWFAMGRELFLTNKIFRKYCEDHYPIFNELLDFDITQELMAASEADSHLRETRVAQPILFQLQCALVHTLGSMGIVPDFVLGHSLGEIAAACVSGAMSYEDCAKLVSVRGSIMNRSQDGKGKMVSIQGISIDSVARILEENPRLKEVVSLAAHNSPRSVVVSGLTDECQEVIDLCKGSNPGMKSKDLPNVDYAFHSPCLENSISELTNKLIKMKIQPSKPSIPMISTLTGDLVSVAKGDLSPSYWASQMRQPVQFSSALSRAISAGCTTFIEISPSPVLSSAISEILLEDGVAPSSSVVLSTLHREYAETFAMRKVATDLWVRGHRGVSLSSFLYNRAFVTNLPKMPMLRESYWIELEEDWWKKFAREKGEEKSLEKTKDSEIPDFSSKVPLSSCFYSPTWEILSPSPPISSIPKTKNCPWMMFLPSVGSESRAKIESFASSENFSIFAQFELERSGGEGGTGFDLLSLSSQYSESKLSEVLSSMSESISGGEGEGEIGILFGWPLDCIFETSIPEMSEVYDLAVFVHFLLPLRLLRCAKARGETQIPLRFPLLVPCSSLWSGFLEGSISIAEREMRSHFLRYSLFCCSETSPSILSLAISMLGPSTTRSGSIHRLGVGLKEDEGIQIEIPVLSILPPPSPTHPPPSPPPFTILITGGTSGIGFELASYLAHSHLPPARLHLLLASRRGLSALEDSKMSTLKFLRSIEGVEVDVLSVDFSLSKEEILSRCPLLPTVNAVVHAAGVFDKGLISRMDESSASATLRSKALSILRLLALVPANARIVLFSSFSALVPLEGSVSYASANAFLNCLSRSAPQRIIAINWGRMKDVGMSLTQSEESLLNASRLGLGTLKVSEVVSVARNAILGTAGLDGVVGVFRMDWERFDSFMNIGSNPYYSLIPLISSSSSRTATTQTPSSIREFLLAHFADALNVPPLSIDTSCPLDTLGLDSMVVVSIASELQTWLGKRVSPSVIYDYPTIDALSEHLGSGEEVEGVEESPQPSVPPSSSPSSSLISISGLATRLPGGITSPSEFWSFLLQNSPNGLKDAITEIPPERFDIDSLYSPDPSDPNKITSRHGGFTSDLDRFDSSFFSLSPREAERMDPQQRMCLECAVEALQDAGVPLSRISGSKTGVFVGVSSSDYGTLQALASDVSSPYFGIGNALCMNANRISYALNLMGPSLAIDTACSSSLSALHTAMRSLQSGEIDRALVGGVNVVLSPLGALTLSRTGALSPSGKCWAFDERADGFVRSEGCGFILLTNGSSLPSSPLPLPPYAMIESSGVNSDGKSQGLTAPNGISQQALYSTVYGSSSLSARGLRYVECHGTGTHLGDPIEVENLGEWISLHGGSRVGIGSVKSALGHLESAAGMASLIKAALIASSGIIPPQINFSSPNPIIEFSNLPLSVSGTEGAPSRVEVGERVGVSSFGFGGTNGHIALVRVPPPPPPAPLPPTTPAFVTFSSKNLPSLIGYARKLLDWCLTTSSSTSSTPTVGEIASSLLTTRDDFDFRIALLGIDDREDLIAKLKEIGDLDLSTPAFPPLERVVVSRGEYGKRRLLPPQNRSSNKNSLGVVFSGQTRVDDSLGATVPLLGGWSSLVSAWPELSQLVKEMTLAMKSVDPVFDLKTALTSTPAPLSTDTSSLQRCYFGTQVLVGSLLKKASPSTQIVMTGHSIGEIAAAVVSGRLSLREGSVLVALRSEVVEGARARGGKMVAISGEGVNACEFERLKEEKRWKEAWVSVVNSPSSIVVSGKGGVVEKIAEVFEKREEETFVRVINEEFAFHSPLLEEISIEFVSRCEKAGLFEDEFRTEKEIRLISTIQSESKSPIRSIDYWVNHLLSPVDFGSAMEKMFDLEGFAVSSVIEVGLSPSLSRSISEMYESSIVAGDSMAKDSLVIVPTLNRGRNEASRAGAMDSMMRSIAILHCVAQIDGIARALLPPMSDPAAPAIRLPTYAWDHSQRHWILRPSTDPPTAPSMSMSLNSRLPPTHSGCRAALLQRCPAAGLTVQPPSIRSFVSTISPSGPLAWEYDHWGFDCVLIPGVTYLEASLSTTKEIYGQRGGAIVLSDIEFVAPLWIPEFPRNGNLEGIESSSVERDVRIDVSETREDRISDIVISSMSSDEEEKSKYSTLFRASIHRDVSSWSLLDEDASSLDVLLSRCNPSPLAGSIYYSEMKMRGLDLGRHFRGIDSLYLGNEEHPSLIVAKMKFPFVGAFEESDFDSYVSKLSSTFIPENYSIFPPILDAHMQVLGAAMMASPTTACLPGLYLPVSMERLRYNRGVWGCEGSVAIVEMRHCSPKHLIGDVSIAVEGSDGKLELCLKIEGFRVQYGEDTRPPVNVFYDVEESVESEESRLKSQAEKLQDFTIVTEREILNEEDSSSWMGSSHLVYLPSLGSGKSKQSTNADLITDSGLSMLNLFQKLAKRFKESLPRVTVILRAFSRESPQVHALVSLIRVIRNELPLWKISSFVVGLETPLKEILVGVGVGEEEEDGGETVRIVESEKKTVIPRLVPSRFSIPTSTSTLVSSSSSPHRLEVTKPGSIRDGISLLPRPLASLPPLRDGQVVLRVSHAGVNFRDVLKVLGVYPVESDDSSLLGFECSGIVVASRTRGLKPGDRVMAVGSGTMSSLVVTEGIYTFGLPDGISLEDASTIFGAYVTSHFALVEVGRLRRGESVLIHSGAGGVGIAAIHVAQSLGAKVYVTVGKKEKREFVQERFGITPNRIFDSRSLRFADDVLRATNGKGVNVVLNSLYGEGLRRSLECLSFRGRFIEIGKRDVYENTNLGLRALKKSISFSTIAIDEVFELEHEFAHELLKSVMECLSKGIYQPLPRTVFASSEVSEAFKFMASGNHIGKIVLSFGDAEAEENKNSNDDLSSISSSSSIDLKTGSWLITGASGGVAMMISLSLVKMGVRSLILTSRSMTSLENDDTVCSLRSVGASVRCIDCDFAASSEEIRNRLFDVLDRDCGEVVGIVHCAGVISDALLPDMTEADFRRVVDIKCRSAMMLHEWSISTPERTKFISRFVLISSAASLLGNIGQANYAFANGMLDGLASYRRRILNLSGSKVVNFGAIGDVGMFARMSESLRKTSLSQGIRPLSRDDMLRTVKEIVAPTSSSDSSYRLVVTNVNWRKFVASVGPNDILKDIMSKLEAEEDEENSENAESSKTFAFRSHYRKLATTSDRSAFVRNSILEKLASVLGASTSSIDIHKPLNELGLDSMVAIELRAELESGMGVVLPIVVLIQGPSVSTLSDVIVKQLDERLGEASSSSSIEEVQSDSVPYNEDVIYPLVSGAQSNEAKSPFFFFCLAGGFGTLFTPLVSAIADESRPMYAVQAVVLHQHPTTFESLIERFITELRLVQPHGPYYLAGHSLGAVECWLVAQKLLESGEDVKKVILLDPVSLRMQDTTFRNASDDVEGSCMTLFARNQQTARNLNLSASMLSRLQNMSGDDRWELFYAVCDYVEPGEQEAVKFFIQGMMKEISLARSFQFDASVHSKHRLECVVISARDNDEFIRKSLHTEESLSDWRSVGENVTFDEMNGDHWTILEEPNVDALASMVKKAWF